jgi:hypothetical protein
VATNPLPTAFDQLSRAVKQTILSAHGLAPNPTDDGAGIIWTLPAPHC